jgi:hypothetical protein
VAFGHSNAVGDEPTLHQGIEHSICVALPRCALRPAQELKEVSSTPFGSDGRGDLRAHTLESPGDAPPAAARDCGFAVALCRTRVAV